MKSVHWIAHPTVEKAQDPDCSGVRTLLQFMS